MFVTSILLADRAAHLHAVPELAKLLRQLEAGDVLMVTRLDRLARSTRDLLNILGTIGTAGAGFKSLGEAWADTTIPHGRLCQCRFKCPQMCRSKIPRCRGGDQPVV
jgi:DNA invertase Pin-like site-specific DNA recombinase